MRVGFRSFLFSGSSAPEELTGHILVRVDLPEKKGFVLWWLLVYFLFFVLCVCVCFLCFFVSALFSSSDGLLIMQSKLA